MKFHEHKILRAEMKGRVSRQATEDMFYAMAMRAVFETATDSLVHAPCRGILHLARMPFQGSLGRRAMPQD